MNERRGFFIDECEMCCNKAAGGTRALQRVGAPGHRLERLPCTAAATGGVWREAAQRRLAVEILMGGVGGEEEGH